MVNIASQRGGTVGIVGVGMRVTALLVLVVATSTGGWAQSRLPQCPRDYSVTWTNCFGTYTFPDGQKYVGEFRDNKFHGQGTLTFPDGWKSVGEFRDDKMNGQGTSTFPDGAKYVGEFRDNKRNGQGTLTFPDGEKYVGLFQDDKKHGQGTYTFPDGRKYVDSNARRPGIPI